MAVGNNSSGIFAWVTNDLAYHHRAKPMSAKVLVWRWAIRPWIISLLNHVPLCGEKGGGVFMITVKRPVWYHAIFCHHYGGGGGEDMFDAKSVTVKTKECFRPAMRYSVQQFCFNGTMVITFVFNWYNRLNAVHMMAIYRESKFINTGIFSRSYVALHYNTASDLSGYG